MKICFVCHGNICRSTMAEFVLKDIFTKKGIDAQIISRGTSAEELGNDTHHGTKDVLRREGIPFSKRNATVLLKSDCDSSDFIFVMDNNNLRNTKRIAGEMNYDKISLLLGDREVADPWYTGNFDITYSEISTACKEIAEKLAK